MKVCIKIDKKMDNKLVIQNKEWDTIHFNLNVGYIVLEDNVSYHTLNNLRQQIEEKKYDVVYLIIDNMSIDSNICNENLKFVDAKTIYKKDISLNNDVLDDNVKSIHSIKYNIHDLYALALESGKYSRFRVDKNFSNDVFNTLYTLWVDKSLSKEIADDVLVYEENGIIKGFLTYKINDNVAIIGLIAVSPQYQGKKLGSILLKHLENIVINRNVTSIRVETQGHNRAACKFYENNDYKIVNITNIYHLWK